MLPEDFKQPSASPDHVWQLANLYHWADESNLCSEDNCPGITICPTAQASVDVPALRVVIRAVESHIGHQLQDILRNQLL